MVNKLTNFCTNCGNKLEENTNFCSKCGTKLNDEDNVYTKSRVEPEIESENCPVCKGTGITFEVRKSLFGETLKDVKCKNCNGTGKIIKDSNYINKDEETAKENQSISKDEKKKAKNTLKNITGGWTLKNEYREKLKEHGLTSMEGIAIQTDVEREIIHGKLRSEDVEKRIDQLINKQKIVKQHKMEEYNKYEAEKKEIEEKKKELRNKIIEFDNNREIYGLELINESCPNTKLTRFERIHLKYSYRFREDVTVTPSMLDKMPLEELRKATTLEEMEEEVKEAAERIIMFRQKIGKFDCTGELIQDGGYKNQSRFTFELEYDTHLQKAQDITKDVYIKIFDDKIVLIESKFGFKELKRITIFFRDIVFLDMGDKKRESVSESHHFIGGHIASRTYGSGIGLNLNNREYLKIIFDDNTKEELLYNKWNRYKENQENKTSSTSKESNNNVGEELIRYSELYEKGLLTEEEFNALKKKLIGL